MKRELLKTLVLGDDDLDCSCDKITMAELGISHVAFNEEDLAPYNLIVYSGKKGTKILRSTCFKTGEIV